MSPQHFAELITFIAKSLVEKPEKVAIDIIEGERLIILEVRVDNSDIGKIIGRQGRIARSLRTILQAATAHQEKRYALEILD